MARYLMLAALCALAGCADPERDPPMVIAQPSLIDLALATAGATRARMGPLDHLAPLCAREECDIAPMTAAARCAGVADRTGCVFSDALRAYALQLFPPETAGLRLAEYLGYSRGDRDDQGWRAEACAGYDPILCQLRHVDCAIVPTGLGLYDTVMREVIVTLVLRPGGDDFLDRADVAIHPGQNIGRPGYLDCVARFAGEG